MKLLRITLVCSLLLLAASPAFAIGCESCTAPDPPYCESTPDSGTRCRFHIDWCETINSSFCTGRSAEQSAQAVLAEWTVASVEVSRPAQATKVVTGPSAVAQADVAHIVSQK